MEIPATEFKAKCLKIMGNVAKTRESVIITKRGKPIAKLVPLEERPNSLFGCMKGTVEILGDIVSPLEVEWETEAETEPSFYPRPGKG